MHVREIQFQDSEIKTWKIYRAKVTILERDFLIDKITVGGEFQLGTYPQVIAYAKIIEVIDTPIYTPRWLIIPPFLEVFFYAVVDVLVEDDTHNDNRKIEDISIRGIAGGIVD